MLRLPEAEKAMNKKPIWSSKEQWCMASAETESFDSLDKTLKEEKK